MTHFQAFDSLEDMHAAMQAAEREANAHLFPAQKALRDAVDVTRYWYRYWEDLHIFGVAWTREQQEQSERDAGATRDELEHSTQSWDDRRKRGYVFGRAYSVIEPDGELGDTHVSQVLPITGMIFNAAQGYRWTLGDDDFLSTWLSLRLGDMLRGEELKDV